MMIAQAAKPEVMMNLTDFQFNMSVDPRFLIQYDEKTLSALKSRKLTSRHSQLREIKWLDESNPARIDGLMRMMRLAVGTLNFISTKSGGAAAMAVTPRPTSGSAAEASAQETSGDPMLSARLIHNFLIAVGFPLFLGPIVNFSSTSSSIPLHFLFHENQCGPTIIDSISR